MSVSGVKLFLLTESLDLPTPPNLLDAALAVRSVLPPNFTLKLNYEHAREIERVATVARLVLPSFEPGCVELGCMFDEPLSPEELKRLVGKAVPLRGADTYKPKGKKSKGKPAAQPPVVQEARKGRQKTYRVFVATGEGEEEQLLCHSKSIDLEGVQVRASDTAFGAEDAAEAALLFTRRFGTAVSIKIMDGVRNVWTGPAHVLGLEISFARPGDLLISVAYGRELRPAELERLGVAGRRVA